MVVTTVKSFYRELTVRSEWIEDCVQNHPPLPSRTDAAERILEAAKFLFAREGYASVSIRDIAEAADVSKANVFHHFMSKERLYLEVLRRTCDSARHLLSTLEGSEAGPVDERLRHFIYADLQRGLDDLDGTRLVLSEAFDSNPCRARALADEVFGDGFAQLTRLVTEGQQSGEWRPDIDPALMASLIVAANAFFLSYREVLRQLPGIDFADHPERYAEMVVEILLHGIRSPGAP